MHTWYSSLYTRGLLPSTGLLYLKIALHIINFLVSDGWGHSAPNILQCVFVFCWVLIVESNIVFFNPFVDVFVKLPSCISSCILVVLAMFQYCFLWVVLVLNISWLFSSRCLCTGLHWSVRCSSSLCYMLFGCSHHIAFTFVRVN